MATKKKTTTKKGGFWIRVGARPLTADGKRRLDYGDACDDLSDEHHAHYKALGFIADKPPAKKSERAK